MHKLMEYEWIAVRVYGGKVSGGYQARALGQVLAPCWSDAMQRATEKFGVSYGGLAVIPAN